MIGALKGINSALASSAQPSAVQSILPVKRASAFLPLDEGTALPPVQADENQENEGFLSFAGLRPEAPLSSASLASVFSVLEAESSGTDRAASSVPPPAEKSVRTSDEGDSKPAVFGMPEDASEGIAPNPGKAPGIPAVSSSDRAAEVTAAAQAEEGAVLSGQSGLLNFAASLSVNAPLQVQAASAGLTAARSYTFAARLA